MLPKPHREKLKALLRNKKLPAADRPQVERALVRYREWADALGNVSVQDDLVEIMVSILNSYRLFLDLDVIFDSMGEFLYRQKGQLKLDNSVLEEFLPHLLVRAIPALAGTSFELGPRSCYAALSFASSFGDQEPGGGPLIRSKAQDFAISRRLFVRTAHEEDWSDAVSIETHLGYVCAEIKTNLDKTMFQEASATAHDLKIAIPGAKYFLLCEWLDMTPLSTAATDIDEVLVLRKAKRLGSHVRSHFSTVEGRSTYRSQYASYLEEHPFSVEVFARIIEHIREVVEANPLDEQGVLECGFF